MTFYPGASPDVMASSVTAPLERQFGQVPGLKQMTSTSSFGSSVIMLQFALDLNIDVAEQQVQAAINAAGTYLPRDLPNPPIYSKSNPADAPILTLALTSKTLPLSKVEDFADTTLAQKISQLPGVGLVSISGGQRPAVRIQANPTALAAYGLSLEDLRHRARRRPTSTRPRATSRTRASRSSSAPTTSCCRAREYAPLIVAYRNGAPVRLSDVATVIDGAENVRQAAWMNQTPGGDPEHPAAAGRQHHQRGRQHQAPAAAAARRRCRSRSTCRCSPTAPPPSAPRSRDVQFELMLTVALVVMVIFLFLRSLAATIIPSVAVPLSLVGTFGVMYLLGYSLNNLTLMALTISTGFVVDDAIVMIENIARYIEEGEPPLRGGAEGLGADRLHDRFADGLADRGADPAAVHGRHRGPAVPRVRGHAGVTILVSAVVSLTLTPMMCARLLRHKPESQQGRFYRASERVLRARSSRATAGRCSWCCGTRRTTLLVAVGHAGRDRSCSTSSCPRASSRCRTPA